MAKTNYYDTSLNDPFGSNLLIALDKLEGVNIKFNVNTRIDVYVDQNSKQDFLPLVYFKNRWLTDQLEVKDLTLYKTDSNVSSAITLTGRQK